MTPDEQRALVLEHLRRHEEIAIETREQLAQLEQKVSADPLGQVEPAVREAAEDEFFGAQGKRRYKTSDGRTLFLTPEEIAQRRRARSNRQHGGRAHTYGPGADEQRRKWISWGFNIGAIILALIFVMIILH